MVCCQKKAIVKYRTYKKYENFEEGESYSIYTYVNKAEWRNTWGTFYPPIAVSPPYVGSGDRYYWDVTDANGTTTIGGINHPFYDENGQSTAWYEIVPNDPDGFYQYGCELEEEKSFEIELYSIDFSFLRKIPGFSNLPLPFTMSECVFAQPAWPLAGENCVLIKRQASIPINIFNLIKGYLGTPFESVAKVLCSDEGCPPPQVTIVCDDDATNNECPPETDCEIVCNGFKCCYHNGQVIKVIPV